MGEQKTAVTVSVPRALRAHSTRALEAQASPLTQPRDWGKGWKQGRLPGGSDTQTESHVTVAEMLFKGGGRVSQPEGTPFPKAPR